ncbi:MAG: fumarate reductase subunit D [Bacteroidetes bacterium]|nr:fumarate reductase subunit D [Bacteroidota bacterium]MDA1121437.1 fumarate reductase subunit D [Bacteroidota bacterium]
MKKSNEPFWWAMFGAGGVLSAFFIPILIFLFALAFPLGWLPAPSFDQLEMLTSSLIVKLFLFALIFLSLFHWAHRFRFTLYDGLQVKHLNELIAVLSYGTALFGTVAAGWVLFFG